MGCLKKFIKVLILSFAVIGFISVDGPDKIAHFWTMYVTEGPLIKHSMDIIDLSNVEQEFEIDKQINLFGYKGILAEHNESNQKFLIINTKEKILTEKDISSNDLENKLRTLLQKQRRNSAIPTDIMIYNKAQMRVLGKNVYYANFRAKVPKIPFGNNGLDGMIAVVEYNDNDSRILVSVNQNGKYSQALSQRFFSQITK